MWEFEESDQVPFYYNVVVKMSPQTDWLGQEREYSQSFPALVAARPLEGRLSLALIHPTGLEHDPMAKSERAAAGVLRGTVNVVRNLFEGRRPQQHVCTPRFY